MLPVLLALFAAPNPPAHTLIFDERTPLALLVNTPTGEAARVPTSELIRIVGDLLKQHTDLSEKRFEQSVVTDCGGRLVCLSLKARSDYKRQTMELANGTLEPYSAHLKQLKERDIIYPRYLMLLSNIALEGRADRVTLLMLDTDKVLAMFHEAQRATGWEDELEAKVSNETLISPILKGEIASPEDARKLLQKWFRYELRPALKQREHWEPFSYIDIVSDVDKAAINIDGAAIGATVSGTTRIRIPARPLELSLSLPGYKPFSTKIDAKPGQTISLVPDLSKPKRESALNPVVLWSGVALSAAGAAMLVTALARQDGDLYQACIGTCDGGSTFQRITFDPGKASTDPQGVNGGGLLLGPLGYSLLGLGATWSLGAAFLEPEKTPWISVLAGLAVGGLSYGLSAALGDKGP